MIDWTFPPPELLEGLVWTPGFFAPMMIVVFPEASLAARWV
jgi:hypothetical protein